MVISPVMASNLLIVFLFCFATNSSLFVCLFVSVFVFVLVGVKGDISSNGHQCKFIHSISLLFCF